VSFPLRYHVAAALLGLTVTSGVALTTFAYRASRDSLEEQAARAVGSVARAREQALTRLLEGRRDRMEAFLASLESLCAERTPKGRFGWERECVRVALTGFQIAERARAVDLKYTGRRLAARGRLVAELGVLQAGRLASIVASPGFGQYTMQAKRDRLLMRVQFPLDDIAAIFQDRSGLEPHGEVLLTDRRGARLTALGDDQAQTPGEALQQCLAGQVIEVHRADAHGVDAISAFRPVAATGGCAVVNQPYTDVLVPIHQLGKRFLVAFASFIAVGVVLCLVVASAATTPLARLAASARELEAGHFDSRVPVGGPTEVRQLGRAISSMAKAVGELVQREHEARLEAEMANRAKDDFLAMLSHELRTPLTAMLGWSSILLARQDDREVVARGLLAVERSARTQVRLVDELLDISRIASGKLRLNVTPDVSLAAVVHAAVDVVTPSAEEKSITIVKTIEGEPPVVSGDAGRLQQVVGNLLSNAVRFLPQGGRIDVAVTGAGEHVELRVTDNGLGIAPEFLPHVFDRFRQADSSTTRTHAGLGLGLAIARELIELHGGTIRAESRGVGAGATFVVSVPRSASIPMVPPPSTARDAGATLPALAGRHVLFVDDDPETRDVVRAILEGAGATVATTASAAETRVVLTRTPPDVLIADIGMPHEDGYALIRSVRALLSTVAAVPAIALTAHVAPAEVEEALASGFQMHVAKPVDSAKLLSAVAATLLRHCPG
jgi:signal transduction histidine kinase/ActR/RegA family two-component response regulator